MTFVAIQFVIKSHDYFRQDWYTDIEMWSIEHDFCSNTVCHKVT